MTNNAKVKTFPLPTGRKMPALGQGTWHMGENPAKRQAEIDALRYGLDLGMTLIDTAEMYGEGEAERIVGEAIAGRREEVFLVSKIYPHNATRTGTPVACHRSLCRLGTNYLDLYLLHWIGEVPVAETLEAFQSLKAAGVIRDYGVSNFDLDDLADAIDLPGGQQIVTNQVLYNLAHRGIEWDLLPWCLERRIPIMAYSPIENGPREQKALFSNPTLLKIAAAHEATPAQVALSWALHQGVVAIPKASDPAHVRQNRAALDLTLTKNELKELDRAFSPPTRKVQLAMR
ncbi:MAG TPA: aldo/keto reductase [Candidatus Limnocylindrales bacterium]|nr:aldo/keto reductase [Candidatus Limnocylindrales bacterium]